MNDLDKKLDRLFRSLPRERASADFTQRVLLRVAERKNRPRTNTRFVLSVAAATAGIAICVTSFVWYFHQQEAKEQMLAEYQAIKQEYAALAKQHDNYSQNLSEFAVLRLGGDLNTQLVFDLSDFHPVENIPIPESKGHELLSQDKRESLSDESHLPDLEAVYAGGSI